MDIPDNIEVSGLPFDYPDEGHLSLEISEAQLSILICSVGCLLNESPGTCPYGDSMEKENELLAYLKEAQTALWLHLRCRAQMRMSEGLQP